MDTNIGSSGLRPDRELHNTCQVRVIARAGSWIEGEALQQLDRVAERYGMRLAVGLPDLHPGRGHPIGAAFLTERAVYPALVDNDIGCGMALWQTQLPAHFRDFDRWEKRLSALDRPLDESALSDVAPALLEAGHVHSLGTIGGGNHFAELQRVSEVHDQAAFDALGLSKKGLLLLVHSGSRGLGEAVLRAHVREHGDKPLMSDTWELRNYLGKHDVAVEWARANRRLIAQRFMLAVRTKGEPVLDLVHNSVIVQDPARHRFLHRKGAAPADGGAVVIPGSRGAESHLVMPTARAAQTDASAFSLAHGAGRRWKRSECKDRLREHWSADELTRTALGSRVVCGDRELLFEEAPQAYKDVDGVVGDLVAHGLVTQIATLQPVLTFKTSKG
ncbi:MAG: RNA ligase RtcB family protein [Deltaproteobacteria bacterium]|nr:RNA ligase RtcB family protein [Deltaproteobacteria bacterium]